MLTDLLKPILRNRIARLFKNFSYSQNGEDIIVANLFATYGIHPVQYLDIGTNQPDFNNNTYCFYTKGGRGVCVEATPNLIPSIKRVRPLDKILNIGVSTDTGSKTLDFYILSDTGWSTFSEAEAKHRITSVEGITLTKIEKISTVDINTLIAENFSTYPDYLSIDIEGLDYEVLQSLNFSKFPIPVVCVETCTLSVSHIKPKDQRFLALFERNGYELYADTYYNSIFVNKGWFYNKPLKKNIISTKKTSVRVYSTALHSFTRPPKKKTTCSSSITL